MCKILIFSRDPGGANTVIPLIKPLINEGYEILLYGKDTALNKYSSNGLNALNIMDEIDNVSMEDIKQFLIEKTPGLIITGTSADDLTEKFLWSSARQLNIPSFAILDQWINYGLRFSQYGVAELEKFNINPRLEYLPAKIMVMDEMARREAVDEGIDKDLLVITGQPHFESLLQKASAVEDKSAVRKKYLTGDNEKIFLFVSEPISETYRENDNSKHFWGYTERTVFALTLQAIESVSDDLKEKFTVIIRPHPKENINNFNDVIQSYNKQCKIIIDKESDSIDLMNAADLIIGMSSMFLIEAAVLGKKILSVQTGLCRKDPFVLSRMGVVESITDKVLLKRSIVEVIGNEGSKIKFDFIKNPVENIINEVKKLI